MWGHEGKKKKKGRARRKSSSRMASIAFPLGCNPGNALHHATTGPHWEMSVTRRVEERRGWNKRWVDQKCEWRVA